MSRWYLIALVAGLFLYEKEFAYLNIPLGPIPLYVTEAALLLMFLAFIFSTVSNGGYLRIPRHLSLLIVCWLLLGLANLARSKSLDIHALRDSAISYYSLFFFAGYAFSRHCVRMHGLFRLAVLISMVAAGGRILGSTVAESDWLPLFNVLPFGFLVLLAIVRISPRGTDRILLNAAIMMGFASMVTSYLNRSVLLALAAALLFCFRWGAYDVRRLAKWITPLVLVGAVASIYFLSMSHVDEETAHYLTHSGTAEWRLLVWGELLLRTINDNAFFGSGFGSSLITEDILPDNSTALHPHNALITIMAQQGIVGVLLFIAIVVKYLRDCTTALRAQHSREEPAYRLLLALVAYVIYCLVFALLNVALEGPHHGIWFWLAMGASYSVVRRLSVENNHTLHKIGGKLAFQSIR